MRICAPSPDRVRHFRAPERQLCRDTARLHSPYVSVVRHDAHESRDFSPKACRAVRVQTVNGTVSVAARSGIVLIVRVDAPNRAASYPRFPQERSRTLSGVAIAQRLGAAHQLFETELR